MLRNEYGYAWTIASLVVLVVFLQAKRISRAMGKAGSHAVAKVAALFLTGIAVFMIRSGIEGMLQH